MRGAVRSPKRVGREFVRNLVVVLVVYLPLAAVLALLGAAPQRGLLIFGGVLVAVMAAIATVVVLWSGAHDETFLSGHSHPGVPPEGRGLGGWDGGGGDFGRDGGDSGGGDTG
jgi:uncharacterized membrane protein YgcG